MLTPIDGWAIAHGFTGFFLARIKLNRWILYPTQIAWETYQFYFHYQPQGYSFGYIWLNSLIDILICSVCYELAINHSFNYERLPIFRRINNNIKAMLAYALITFSITWAFWDDVFRTNFSAQLPYPQIPLILGAFSPVFASFNIWKWFKQEITDAPRLLQNRLSYSLFTGLIPSLLILLVIILVK